MALVKSNLEKDLKGLLKDVLSNKKLSDDFAKELANIIDAYIKTATVTTTVNTSGLGNTGAPVISTGTGTGSLS